MKAVEFWEDRYAATPQVWSGKVNRVLADVASGLVPGRALDLGAGEGGDAIWLAQQGWNVTAVELSTVAVERARAAADAAGLADEQVQFFAHDLAEWAWGGSFDLVSAFFLQSPVELPRAEILRRAAAVVAPGGHLLIVSHAAAPPWATQLHAHHHEFPTPAQDVASLDLETGVWEVLIADTRQREAMGPDGQPALLDDSVVLVRRIPDGAPSGG